MRDEIVKVCSKCGATYTAREWVRLPFPPKGARQVIPAYPGYGGAVLEYRNCDCGSTLAVVVEGDL